MLIKEYKNQFIEQLSSIYDVGEVESFFYIILENKHQLKRIDLALNIGLKFSEAEIETWNEILEKLKQQIPIQYILGTTSFYDLDFEVNNDVLIPRPETEELVSWILSNNPITESTNKPKILDIGTGSGCIAISLAKNIPNASVYAIDVSEKALAIAKKNASTNKVKVTFIQENILKTENFQEKLDIIVSNPPYVRNLEKQEINKNVLDYEPHLALFVDDHDALIFYRKIAHLAQKNLSENGQLYFEINQYLGNEMVELLQQMHFKNIEIRKDIYGNNRMIFCTIDKSEI
ncbi:peptide chain release factor N(5)-glutamine methyltransferase [Flavobacterium sp.]|uniref:peptide chain release factor N(5)-glutamine methyltransferase n=1 Tax=Flavobacterium sp. TaxID=239 RepID=UPI003752F8E6